MSTITKSYAFCADFSEISACLFAIQTLQISGGLDAEASRLLATFEKDVLRKLYLRTLRVLGIINNVEEVPGIYIGGDFEAEEFSALDFYVGYMDATNDGFSSRFQTILNIFKIFCRRSTEISEEDKTAINAALIPVLDSIEEIQAYLMSKGLNPCGNTDSRFFNNSPGIYLQAAGADGQNGIAEGLHLRWSLTGELGTNHIPKGDYNNSTGSVTGFNRPDDYAYIYRTPYVNPLRVNLDFESEKPVIDFKKKTWTYMISQKVQEKQIINRLKLTFTDAKLYNILAGTLSPSVSHFEFLNQYSGVIKLEVLNKTAFKVGFDFQKQAAVNNAVLKIEALCQVKNKFEATDPINIRKTHVVEHEQVSSVELLGENIRETRIKKSSKGTLRHFYFETYDDFLTSKTAADWTPIGNGFGLSLNDQVVFDRLENSAYPIDNRWPHYNNGTLVKASNYKDKWSSVRANEPGIKTVLQRYLSLSETDPRAEDVLKDDGAGVDAPGLLLSYLDILNLQSMDYHMARMLGLGHIDTPAGSTANDQFVYRLNYRSRKGLNSSEMVDHTYISLPIKKTDQRLPERPEMRPVAYGLPVMKSEMNNAFDINGYISNDNIRAVNIGRKQYKDETADYDFFADLSVSDNGNVFENPKPVLYGVEYRAENQSEYLKPEITHEKSMGTAYYAYDAAYPTTGVLEAVPVPDDETSLYIHFERQTGVHFYAIYGINWFSRASDISPEVATDTTVFAARNSLNPPTDVTVQYIQKEEQLLFTTAVEQAWLKGRNVAFPDQDVNFSRTTFNWLDIEDVSHLEDTSAASLATVIKPDKVKAHFKSGLPLEITGIITKITPTFDPDSDHYLRLTTSGYNLIDGTRVEPIISFNDTFRFKGSILTTPSGQFRVIRTEAGTNSTSITVEKAYTVEAVEDLEEPGNYASQKNFTSPEINSRFSMVENLSNQNNWKPVQESVSLVSFADVNQPHIESSVDTEGNITKQWVGGITGNAVVTPLFGGTDASDDLPGYYKISFEASLPPHPQANLPYDASDPTKNNPSALRGSHVEWYKGNIRVPQVNPQADKKVLEVTIISQASPLVLYAYDPTYQDAPIVDSALNQSPVSVNFHPGYKAYFLPEPGPANSFNGSTLLPLEEENERKSLFGLQTVDSHSGNGFVSKISVPVVLLSRRIEEPVQPEAPLAPGLKVRPDATGKAAFTFDTRIAAAIGGALRKPFGFMFYRTTLEEVIHAFYAPETIVQILSDLQVLTEDPSYDLRAYELVNLIFDPSQAEKFRVFEASPQPYGFPSPDKTGLIAPNDSNEVRLNKLRAAIQGTLLPLTEQPPIFDFLKEGHQTENALPSIRDMDGNLLSASSPKFNPFPMVRKYGKDGEANVTYIRFTDYILNASSRNLYFYAGAEVTNQLMPGALSVFTGPVTVLNTVPSAAPLIHKFSMLPSSFAQQTSVRFQIAPMSPEDQISKIRVYRFADEAKATTLQGMDSHFDVEIEAGPVAGYEIVDDFSGLTKVPLGETLHYRFVGIRTILNEKEVEEEVFSYGSELISLKLIDTSNPDAPELTYESVTNKLTWLPTTKSGTYHLFKQNKRGNWERIYSVEHLNSSSRVEYVLPSPLIVLDEEGNRIYHRFKVQVQNTSGLFSLSEKEMTI